MSHKSLSVGALADGHSDAASESFLGTGILNRDDEEWKTVRHVIDFRTGNLSS